MFFHAIEEKRVENLQDDGEKIYHLIQQHTNGIMLETLAKQYPRDQILPSLTLSHS